MQGRTPKLRILKEDALTFMLLRQGLAGGYRFRGKEGIQSFIHQAGSIQYDPVDICGRSPELVLLSRVEGFTSRQLDTLLYKERSLIDCRDKELCITEAEAFPLLQTEERRNYWKRYSEIENAAPGILSEIERRGPLSSKDIEHDGRFSLWGMESRLVPVVLDSLFISGILGIHHKKGSVKYYDLIGNCIDESILKAEGSADRKEYIRTMVLRRIGAVGLLWNRSSPAFLGISRMSAGERTEAFSTLEDEGVITRVRAEDLKYDLFLRSDDLPLLEKVLAHPYLPPRCEFIAPLDSFIWDRELIEALSRFAYKWEIYTPPKDRKYGAYVLPVIYRNRFIGRIEPVFSSRTGTLEIRSFFPEENIRVTEPMKKAMQKKAARLEAYLKNRVADRT